MATKIKETRAADASVVKQAVDLLGSQSALAERLGVNEQRIAQWLKGDYCEPEFMVKVVKVILEKKFDSKP